MAMKPGPRAALKMVEPEIVVGAWEGWFDMPATAAERQATRFGGRAMQVGAALAAGSFPLGGLPLVGGE